MRNNTQIFITKIPLTWNASNLVDIFQKYGQIRDVTVKRGFGFVEFNQGKEAERAVTGMKTEDNVDGLHVE